MMLLTDFYQESAKGGGKKRERVASEVGETTPKPRKKVMKTTEKTQKTEPSPKDSFKPFDYSQSDLKVFAGVYIYILLSPHTLDLALQSVTFLIYKNIEITGLLLPLQVPSQRTTHSLIQTDKPMISRRRCVCVCVC